MLPVLLALLPLAPLFWLLAPEQRRSDVLALGSLIALGLYDVRLLALVVGVILALWGLVRAVAAAPAGRRTALTTVGLAALAALFVWNKSVGRGLASLSSQSGLAFAGVSYLVLKTAAALIETARGTIRSASLRELAAWIAFLPTYPSGPMEDFEHFRRQRPRFDRRRALPGLERILVGLVKALLIAHPLGDWSGEILAHPDAHVPPIRLLALYAFTLRFYLDFSGYSDIAIGLGAVFGYEIQENFDWPLVRRNLVQLWQHWHMTLTGWLRSYLFVPVSRRLLRRGGAFGGWTAIAAGQVVAMTFCGLWHGLGWNFALWGFVQAVGLFWVGTVARQLGRRLPLRLVRWWRSSRTGYALSAFLTFHFFSFSLLLVAMDTRDVLAYLRLLLP